MKGQRYKAYRGSKKKNTGNSSILDFPVFFASLARFERAAFRLGEGLVYSSRYQPESNKFNIYKDSFAFICSPESTIIMPEKAQSISSCLQIVCKRAIFSSLILCSSYNGMIQTETAKNKNQTAFTPILAPNLILGCG